METPIEEEKHDHTRVDVLDVQQLTNELVDLPHFLKQGSVLGNIGIGILATSRNDAHTNMSDFVRGYLDEEDGGEGYYNLTHDSNRVNAYKQAIAGAITYGGCSQWLEIGPGADAVLTRLVLNKSQNTSVIAVEGNLDAARHASSKLATAFPSSSSTQSPESTETKLPARWQVISALTTEPSAKQAITACATKTDAVLSELFGMIMSAEYVVDIINDIHQLGVTTQKKFLPRWGATFYTPVCLDAKRHLKQSLRISHNEGVGVALAPDGQWLHARRLPIQQAAVFRDSVTNLHQSGCLEFVDFASALGAQQMQTRVATFRNHSTQALLVDGFACWVWAGFDVTADKSDESVRHTGTAFPYDWTPSPDDSYSCDIPAASSVKASLSSFSGEPDLGSYASSWRNVVMLLRSPLLVQQNTELRVTSTSDLRAPYQPTYAWSASVIEGDGTILDKATTCMTQPYHMYDFDELQ